MPTMRLRFHGKEIDSAIAETISVNEFHISPNAETVEVRKATVSRNSNHRMQLFLVQNSVSDKTDSSAKAGRLLSKEDG
jgi:hypothetical protein